MSLQELFALPGLVDREQFGIYFRLVNDKIKAALFLTRRTGQIAQIFQEPILATGARA